MEIRPTRGYRLFVGIGGLFFAVLFPVLWLYAGQGKLPLGDYLLTVPFVALGVSIAMAGVLPAYLRADDSSITFKPPLWLAKSFPRSSLSRIRRSGGGRAGPALEFMGTDDKRLFYTQTSFTREDVEALAKYLGVSLYWDFGADSTLKDLPPNA